MDQTSLVWRKKIKAMEKVKPQAPEYPLVTAAKYLHALDTLYEKPGNRVEDKEHQTQGSRS